MTRIHLQKETGLGYLEEEKKHMKIITFEWKIELKPMDIVYFLESYYVGAQHNGRRAENIQWCRTYRVPKSGQQILQVFGGTQPETSTKYPDRPRCRRENIFRPKHHNHHYKSYQRHFLVYRPERYVLGVDLGQKSVMRLFFPTPF